MVKHTARELLKILKQNGFFEYSVTGDHHKFKNDKGWVANVRYSRLKDTISKGVYDDVLNAIHGKSKWQLLHRKNK